MRLRRRPRYADIAATLALVVAMGGTAYAADNLPPNSVDTQSIQNGAVTAPKLHVDSVGTAKIIDGTIQAQDIAAETITSAQLATDSVNATEIADNSIDTGEIIDNSLTGTDITNGSLTGTDVSDGSLTGTDVASNSVGLADLVGADVSGAISFSLGANACGTLNMSIGGAAVGQAVLITYTGTVTIPSVMFSPARVVSTNNVTLRACNLSSSSVSVSNMGVRVVTFG